MLEEKIKSYLLTTGQTLEQLAEQIDVRFPTLIRLTKGGEDASCSFYEAFQILTHIVPDDASSILEQNFPELMDEYARNLKTFSDKHITPPKKDEIKKHSNIIHKVFQSVHHYRLYGWILAGISRENILKKFGVDGISLLEEFVAAQVVMVLGDGSIIPIVEDAVVLSNYDLVRQAELNIELLEFSSAEAWVWTRITNLSPHAVTEVRAIMQDARRRIWEIMADESNSGALPVHLTMITDFIR
ncbi:MAG TPA: hypothetical protein VE954_07715 [Oligoflexus sp.]|uniref:hypothetical protein n=1 Tax=Oligoflexus sp. TaxID=1971216 RepID=UPI002D43787D|nr:hypothetical protein [Oligoflexus sp.]HYX32987.1 hypothetical protein [Oligoflexus sp.]